ncbi:MAG: Glu-tRNA(Gln) amidotransferase subunit GatE [Candidatus Diapherotrites archaeon]
MPSDKRLIQIKRFPRYFSLIAMDCSSFGLKCGIEVHQQLDTGKLFCRCPSILKEGKPDFVFKRRLRTAASEMGEIDRAAAEQSGKQMLFEYYSFNDCCCLVEADEEPPKEADKEALETALKIALMCNARVFDELFVMRKIVLDGSNTSGFQRTMLVAENGFLELKDKKIGIQTIVLEEDSCRPIEKNSEKIVYSLDRQGIPLIEIATAPEIKSPQEAQECALKIGELLRRTCKAKRGLGTIRQDINISIEGGARIELKGVQELEMISKFVELEVQRQAMLIELKKELEKRGITEKDLQEKETDVSEIFSKTECKFVASDLKAGKKAFAIKLKGFAGLIGKELQPDRRFGTEIKDYLNARHNIKGLLHSDELPKYGISAEEKKKIAEKLDCKEKDAFLILIESQEKSSKAFETVRERCALALKGIPEETRNALENGSSSYSRPLPGAARMYPETDLKTISIDKKTLEELKRSLPLTIAQRLELYKKHGLSSKLAEEMKLSNHACFFETLLAKGFNATTAAALLLEGLKTLEREGLEISAITSEKILALLEAEKKGKISKDVLLDVLRETAKGMPLEKAIEGIAIKKAGASEIEKTIERIIEANESLVLEKGMLAVNALMGDAMKELRGRTSGKEVMELLEKRIAKKIQEKKEGGFK